MENAAKVHKSYSELGEIAEEFCKLKQEVKALENTLEVLREILLSAAQEHGGKVEEGGFVIELIEKTRKSFDIKSAEKILDPNLLKPFYTETKYEELRVK